MILNQIFEEENITLDFLKKLRKTEKVKNRIRFKCHDCGKDFEKSIWDYSKTGSLCKNCAQKKGIVKNRDLFKCPFCQKEFDRYHIQKHKDVCEKNPKNYIDPDKYYTQEDMTNLKQLPTSFKKHHFIKFKCLQCGKEGTKAIWNLVDRGCKCSGCLNKESFPERNYKKVYTFEDSNFDSSWELMFYIWAKDNDLNIVRSTKRFEFEFNGIKHNYYPDFEIDGQLIEIKGDLFFDKIC